FGTTPATSYTVNTSGWITAVAPPAVAGTVDIIISAAAGVSSLSSADHFTYTSAGAPAVTAVSPASGTTAGGTIVTITGSGFTGATAVSFGSLAAASFTINADNSIVAVPPLEAAGTVDVRVTTYAGTSSIVTADHYTFTNVTGSAPTVTAVSPTSGSTAGGTS